MYPTKETLESVYKIDLLTGDMTPKSSRSRPCKKNNEGYLVAFVDGLPYLAHRCIWIAATGIQDFGCLDHKDGDRANNAIENLRIATKSQNAMNRKADSRNTSGHKGVSWDSRTSKWKAEIRKGKKRVFRKYFDNIDSAIEAVIKARIEIHGEFARHA
ncbi:HNH homing endonuclease [Pseudomonas phage AH02]|nr:HNH homing endonuclease [Pseudomonas phage AH02]